MTAITKHIRSYNVAQYLQAVVLLGLGRSAACASFNDIQLTFLVLVLAFSADDKVHKLSISAGGLAVCGVISLTDNIYLPYFLALVTYITLTLTVDKDRLNQLAALIILVGGLILFPYFYLGIWYQLLALVQVCAVGCVATLYKWGRAEVEKYTSHPTFTQLFCALLYALFITSAQGFTTAFYPAAGFAMAACWLSIKEKRTDLCLVFSLCMVLSIADRSAFIGLLSALGRCLLAGCIAAEKEDWLIFLGVPVMGLGANLALMPQVGSFGVGLTSLWAVAVYIALPYIFSFQSVTPAGEIYRAGKDYRQLEANLKKLTSSLDYLGNCAVDISRINEKTFRPQSLADMVAEDVCRKCKSNGLCWGEKYSFTQQQFTDAENAVQRGRQIQFAQGFCTQCGEIQLLATSFQENNRILLSKKYITQSQKNNIKILQSALLSVSTAVGDLVTQSESTRLVNTAHTQQLADYIHSLNIPCTYCLCTLGPDKAIFATLDRLTDGQLFKIRTRAEQIYGTKFIHPTSTVSNGETVYTMLAQPPLTFEYSAKSTPLQAVNGDNASMFTNGEMLYVIISDGMGTGIAAAGESDTATSMAKSLLMAGVTPENTVNMVNVALSLRGVNHGGATLDVLRLNLFTGRATLHKAGAGETMVIGTSGVNRYYQPSLPLGLVRQVHTARFSFTVSRGDTIIMYTDGITIPQPNASQLSKMPVEQISAQAISDDETLDDKTIVTIRLKAS